MTKREMNETIESRLDKGYEVTDILTEPQEYFFASCWSWLKKVVILLQFKFARDWKVSMSGSINPAKCTLMVLFDIITKLSLARESITEDVMLMPLVGIISILKHFRTFPDVY